MRLLAWTLIGLFCFVGCVPEKGTKRTPESTTASSEVKPANQSNDKFTIFLSGNTLSQLKPCGCAEGQLGGFSRRQVIFDEVDADNRLLIDTGNFLKDNTPQDMVKLNTIITSLVTLEYDVVNFGEDDLQAASERYPIDQLPFRSIGTSEKLDRVFKKDLAVGDTIATVTVASVSSEELEVGTVDSDRLEEMFITSKADSKPVNILIIDRYSKSIADFLTDSNIDVVVCGDGNDNPEIIKTGHSKPLFISVGKIGKYLGRLDVTLSDDLKLSYSKKAVDKKLPASAELENIYEGYREMVRAENLLGQVIKTTLPDGHEYAGSDKCSECHDYEHEKWSNQSHAHAYQTLVDSGDAYDPECIECHVIGLKYESGFENENSPKWLRDVGCEVCHGPRSKHIKYAMDNTENAKLSEPIAAQMCISCHTPEHSPGFQADEAGYRKKITHWKELKSE
jgi:hypothetical protein